MYKTLTGDWRFRRADQGDWMPAKVPGCNFLDLMAAGKIPDPFVGMNEKEVGWVGHADWVYEKQFAVTAEELQADAVYLRCDMLDTICDVTLNGHRVLQGKNCFVPYRVPVKERLQVGENTLTIRFYSPVEYVSAAYKKCMTPINSNGQCHFGWDWGPVLPVSGITEEIGLDFVDTARVAQLSVRQQLQGDGAVITAKAQVEQYGDCTCTLQVTCPDGTVLTARGECPGRILEAPAGENGFGYDPLFLVEGRSFGRYTAEEKDKISHRGRALRTLAAELEKRI